MSWITSRNARPVLATSEGLVVTPSTTPMAAASRISLTSAESMKIFMGSLLLSRGFARAETAWGHSTASPRVTKGACGRAGPD